MIKTEFIFIPVCYQTSVQMFQVFVTRTSETSVVDSETGLWTHLQDSPGLLVADVDSGPVRPDQDHRVQPLVLLPAAADHRGPAGAHVDGLSVDQSRLKDGDPADRSETRVDP